MSRLRFFGNGMCSRFLVFSLLGCSVAFALQIAGCVQWEPTAVENYEGLGHSNLADIVRRDWKIGESYIADAISAHLKKDSLHSEEQARQQLMLMGASCPEFDEHACMYEGEIKYDVTFKTGTPAIKHVLKVRVDFKTDKIPITLAVVFAHRQVD